MKIDNNKKFDYSQQEKTIGEYLKELREAQGISIKDISAKTKIRQTHIVCLENNNLSKLPSKIYVIGFLKSITEALGVSSKEAVELFEKTLNDKKEKQSIQIDLGMLPRNLPLFAKPPSKKLSYVMMSSVILCALSVFFIFFQIKSFKRANNDIQQKAAVVVRNKITPIEKPIVLDSKELLPMINPTIINLSIKATSGTSWMAYKIDKEPIVKFTLNEGNIILLKGKKIKLLVGNYKVLNITKDNVPVAFQKKSINLTANLIFPEHLKEKYKEPYFVFNENGSALTRQQYELGKGI